LTTATVAASAASLALPAHAQFSPPIPTGTPVGTADPFGGLRPGFPFNPQQPPNGNGFPSTFNNPFANPFTSSGTGFGAFANPFTNPNPFGAQFDPRFANGVVNPLAGTGFNGFNGFNGGNGFDGLTGVVDPRLAGFGGTAIVSPFTSVGMGGYGGTGSSYLPGSLDVGAMVPPTAYTTARLPLLGINTSVRTVGGLPPNLFANRRIGGGASARTRTARAQTNTTARRDANADLEARSATRMAQIMQSRPMVAGHVSRVSLNTIQAKLDSRRSATRSYSPSEVFFYRNDQLLDAATTPGKLRKGEAVLVPDASNQPS